MLCPALSIRSEMLIRRSNETCFLYEKEPRTISFQEKSIDYRTLYSRDLVNYPSNIKRMLSDTESRMIFGKPNFYHFSMTTDFVISVQRSPPSNYQKIERELLSYIQETDSNEGEPFPFDDSLDDLEESWHKYHSCKKKICSMSLGNLYQKIERLLEDVTRQKFYSEQSLIYSIKSRNPEDSRYDMCVELGIIASPSVSDIATFASDKTKIRKYNPYFNEKNVEDYHKEVICWLERCALEDKFNRILNCIESVEKSERSMRNDANNLIRELECIREWSTIEYPEWLLFEVEGKIQIRPNQYAVVKDLLDPKNNGKCSQLNMGEGKTRVIIPMLVLYFTRGNEEKIVRLNILDSLLQEAFDYYHRHLSLSIFGKKLLILPYTRDITLSTYDIEDLHHLLNKSMKEGTVILTSPQYRQSLLLRYQEMVTIKQNITEEAIAVLLKQIIDYDYIDILDECDEILRTNNELIFSVGDKKNLPSLECRIETVEEIFRVISSQEDVENLLLSGGAVYEKRDYFPLIRLNPNFPERTRFRSLIIEEIFRNPSYHFLWVKSLNDLEKNRIEEYVINYKVNLPRLNLSQDNWDYIYSLRGFLAGGILEHCLEMRNTVNYGVDRTKHQKKRLAIPFKAFDTPSHKSEFGHPDVSIMLTVLAYYDDGLLNNEVDDAFDHLLRLGESAQEDIYQECWKLSREFVPNKSKSRIDSVLKIDTSHKTQKKLLRKTFRYNPILINFFLKNIVFPGDMMQFPYKIMATAWHTASSKYIVGFSGTKDKSPLFPLNLSQLPPSSLNSAVTDGKMASLMLSQDIKFMEYSKEEEKHITILNYLISEEYDALIDSGAALTGFTMEKTVKYLLENMGPKYHGIVYFSGDWMAVDRNGNTTRKTVSNLNERDCLVIFDQYRCRGADMKLNYNAKALLTLGTNMNKDSLMQAAGRMRELDKHQSITILVGSDIKHEIKGEGTVSNVDVINWVIRNTIAYRKKYRLNWVEHGIHFIYTKNSAVNYLIKETLALDELYSDYTDINDPDEFFRISEKKYKGKIRSNVLSNIRDI
eukprot:TRINITY_DN6281_c0_g1_i1.p1 TRINITY_DN6281_c0_g1~~TRINITY_DN6281_c0_g1_i1.p1  ORF type:complete len:1215 (-),score=230.04 TRINITY_DN6281_c0_g1_i1:612-3749(-)